VDTVGAVTRRPPWHNVLLRRILMQKRNITLQLRFACPVAVPEKIFGLSFFLDYFDRCHSLTSLNLPPAALGSLPRRRFVTISPPEKFNVLPLI